MAYSIGMPSSRLTERDQPDHVVGARHLVLCTLAGVLIGGAGIAFATSNSDVVHTAFSAPCPTSGATSADPRRELVGDSKWDPKPGNYDAMYRGLKPRHLDWIRKSGSR